MGKGVRLMLTTRRTFMSGAIAACAALPATRLLAADVPDIAILRDAYTAMHPGLYRYATPAQVEARLTALDRTFQSTEDLGQRFLALNRFTATVRCGHTYGNFYHQKDAVKQQLFAGRNRLPFQFRWIGARMVVTLEGPLPRGTEVLRIDGRPVRDILAALIPLVRADGGNDDKRRALLEVRGIDEYETFDIFYPLVFPAADRFALDARLPNGKRRAVVVSAIDLAARQATRPPAREDRGWTVEHRGRVAIITMPDWAMYQTKWDWKAWIDGAMEEMARRGSTGLVLDLRANEGGNDCGDEIIAHLIDAPTTDEVGARRVRFRAAPERLWPYLDTWNPSFRTLGKDAVDRGNVFLELPPDADPTIRPKGPRFKGKVLVLTGPQNSSATFQFASRVRRAGLAKLVGGATGGNRRGINGGAYFFLRLPGGLEVDLPLIGYFPRRPEPDAGLIPDIAVADSIADIAAGRDAVLARALSLFG
jgi:hypothetical protein